MSPGSVVREKVRTAEEHSWNNKQFSRLGLPWQSSGAKSLGLSAGGPGLIPGQGSGIPIRTITKILGALDRLRYSWEQLKGENNFLL